MPFRPVTIYTYAGCGACRQAVSWLRARGIPFTEKPVRQTPPTAAELRRMLKFQEGNVRRLFNTSGQDYRARGLSARLPAMTEAEALELLAANGSLVKRPFVLGPDFGLVGFRAAAWEAAFSAEMP